MFDNCEICPTKRGVDSNTLTSGHKICLCNKHWNMFMDDIRITNEFLELFQARCNVDHQIYNKYSTREIINEAAKRLIEAENKFGDLVKSWIKSRQLLIENNDENIK
jgi:hypothetical protein